MTSDVKYLFMYSQCLCIFICKVIVQVFCLAKYIGSSVLLFLSCRSHLYILDKELLPPILLADRLIARHKYSLTWIEMC